MSYFISALLVRYIFSCGPSTFSSEVSPLCLVLLWADLLGSPCESVVQRRSQYSEEARSRCVSELEARRGIGAGVGATPRLHLVAAVGWRGLAPSSTVALDNGPVPASAAASPLSGAERATAGDHARRSLIGRPAGGLAPHHRAGSVGPVPPAVPLRGIARHAALRAPL